jgi:probable HAF family extracellular repeat protein
MPTYDEAMHAFLWDGMHMGDLGTLGGAESSATSINTSGQIVGDATLANGARHAFVWDEGVLHDLNDLLPADTEWELTSATGVNDSGQIVGLGRRNGATRGFILLPSS